MTATAAGAESLAPSRAQGLAEAYGTASFVEFSSDLAVSADLEFPGDVVLLPPAPPDTPSILRLSMSPDAVRDLVDQFLRLGYQLRRAAPAAGRATRMQQFFVRGGPGGPLALRCLGAVTVLPGAEGRFTLAPARAVRIARDALWAGDVDAGEDVWLEAGACVRGRVRTPGTLVLDEGAHVEGTLQVGRVRFRSGETPEPLGLQRFAGARPVRPEPSLVSLVTAWPAVPHGRPEPSENGATDAGPGEVDVMLGGPAPVQRADPFEGLPALPGRFRVLATVTANAGRDELPKPLRAHRVAGRLLEVELLRAGGKGMALLLHPGTPAQRRVSCSLAEARRDPVLAQLIPAPSGLTTLRLVYGDGVRGVRASADSLRWLIMLFGKVLRLESRLDRLEEMRILTADSGPAPPRPGKRRRPGVDRAKRRSRRGPVPPRSSAARSRRKAATRSRKRRSGQKARSRSPARKRAPKRSSSRTSRSRRPRTAHRRPASGARSRRQAHSGRHAPGRVRPTARRPRGGPGVRAPADRARGRREPRPAPRSSR